jgi:hypothetical protein
MNDYRDVAEALADSGLVVLYVTRNASDDFVEVIEKARPKLYVMNEQFLPFLQHMAKPEERILGEIGVLPKATLDMISAAKTVKLNGDAVSTTVLNMVK